MSVKPRWILSKSKTPCAAPRGQDLVTDVRVVSHNYFQAMAVPLLLGNRAPTGYAGERMTVQAVRTYEPAKVAPVVMETDDGSTIIWLVDQDTHGASPAQGEDESQSDELEMDAADNRLATGNAATPDYKAAIARYEEFLHALGEEDLDTIAVASEEEQPRAGLRHRGHPRLRAFQTSSLGQLRAQLLQAGWVTVVGLGVAVAAMATARYWGVVL